MENTEIKTETNSGSQENLAFDVKKQEKKEHVFHIVRLVICYAFLVIVAFFSIFPFYWMIMSSLKTYDEYVQTIPTYFPHTIQWSNYADAFGYQNNLFMTSLFNTLLVGILSTLASLVMTVLAGYAFAKMTFKGKDLLFSVLLGTMMLPGELFTITNYATVAHWHWNNSYVVLIIPFLVSIYYIYLLRNAFKQIPESLYKAAKVDGISDFKYLITVMIPLTAPTIFSITILKLIGTWNSYIWPRLVNTNIKWQLVSNWMSNCSTTTTEGYTNYPVKMAAAVIISIPLFIVFVFFRKYIMKGVSKSGTKG